MPKNVEKQAFLLDFLRFLAFFQALLIMVSRVRFPDEPPKINKKHKKYVF